MRGRFLEAILQWTERKLAGPGPRTSRCLVAGGAPGGAAPSLGRARCLAAGGGYVNPASRGATSLHPGASRRSIPSRGSRGTGKPRTHCAARMRRCGCLKLRIRIERDAATYSASYAGLTRVSITLRKSLSKRMDCRVEPGNDGVSAVSRARCGIPHAASQNRDPGFFELQTTGAPALQCTASRRATRCAASGARLPQHRRE
jgi:hypothetical protein